MIEPHFGAFLVDVGAVYFVVVVGVEDRRVNFLSGGAWLNVEVVVMVDHNARQSSLGGDPHRPRAHVTLGGAGASKADKSRKVSNVSGAERRGGTKEMLGSNKVVAFNRITFVEPRRRDDIGRTEKIFREKKELGSKRVDREQPSVPDLNFFRDREVLLRAGVSVVANTLDQFIMAGSENFVKVSTVTNGNT
jgi:hypothetical protein